MIPCSLCARVQGRFFTGFQLVEMSYYIINDETTIKEAVMKKIILAALAVFLILAGGAAFAKEAAPEQQILAHPLQMQTKYLLFSATGGFSSKMTDYKIFRDPVIPQSDFYDVFVTGPLPDGMGINATKPKKLELFFRSVKIEGNVPLGWRVGIYSGCIAVRDKFICSFIAPINLMENGEVDTLQGKVKVEMLVAQYSNDKEYSGADQFLTEQSVTEILNGPHSPLLLIHDLNRNGEPDNLCGNIDIPSPSACQ